MVSFCPFARLKNVVARTEIEERDSCCQYLVVISLFDLPMILNTLKYVACEKTPIVILVAKRSYKRMACFLVHVPSEPGVPACLD